jgi:hypothetical protein
LLWLVPLDWHDQLSSKWILSHFTWYKSRRSRHVHDACAQKANAGIQSVQKCMADAVIEGKHYSDVSATIDKITADAAIPKDQVRSALRDGWSQGAEERSRAQPIGPEELMAMDKIMLDAGFKKEEIQWTVGGWSMDFSIRIWTVLHDQIQPYQGPVNFNVQAGEVPVWGLPNMILKQQRTTSSYVGGYSGASMRVASGIYYHFGGVRGHRVESTSLEEVDYGSFLMTTRAIYFGGTARGINLRLPYSQIIRFQPYLDAVGICRNAAREQVFVPFGAHTPAGIAVSRGADRSSVQVLLPDLPKNPIVFPDCGWFLFNILQALAAKDAASKGSYA